MSQLVESLGPTSGLGGTLSLCVGLKPRGLKRTAGTSRMS
jgi:hypothetical protein